MVVDCLVEINKRLTEQAVHRAEENRNLEDPSAEKEYGKRLSLQRYTSFRGDSTHAQPSELTGSQKNSPKARRILGMDPTSANSIVHAPLGSTPRLRRNAQKNRGVVGPLFQSRNGSDPNLLGGPKERDKSHLQPELQRSASLSGPRSLIVALIGGDQTQTTPSPKSGRAEKYLRGVMDKFRFKSPHGHDKSESEQLSPARAQTGSLPAGVKLSAHQQMSARSSHHDMHPANPEKHDETQLPVASTNHHNKAGTFAGVTGMKLPALGISFHAADKVPLEKKGGRSKPRECPASSSVAEEQIMEVLLEYIHKKLAPPSGIAQSPDFGETNGSRLPMVIQSLNHISFDTRFKVRD